MNPKEEGIFEKAIREKEIREANHENPKQSEKPNPIKWLKVERHCNAYVVFMADEHDLTRVCSQTVFSTKQIEIIIKEYFKD